MTMKLKLAGAVIGATVFSMGMSISYAEGVSMSDKSFMKEAAQAGHYEIQAANEALATSQNEQVKEFAQMMLNEHEQLDKALNELAIGKDYTLPNSPSMVQEGKLLLLKGKDGHNFDEYYAENLAVKAHEDTIELFEKQAEKGDDEEIAGFAQDSLPMLRQHLQHGELLKQHVDAATGKK